MPVRWPSGKRFAFTIVDDTDDARVQNVKPIYDLLAHLSFFTTKTVWPLPCPEGSPLFFAGHTMAVPEYRDFCLTLQDAGFEITWHCATMESSRRERTLEGLETFRGIFGRHPEIHINHGYNRENLYWGPSRYRTLLRVPAHLSHKGPNFEGDRPGSQYFWGDQCKKYMRFVRNFAFREINTLRSDPHTPYRLHSTPWVNWWFSASDAPDASAFKTLVNRATIDRLCAEGGVCVLATHLGKGFVRHGRVDEEVERALRYLAGLPVWVAPVSHVLEHLIQSGRGRILSHGQLFRLELRHARDRFGAALRHSPEPSRAVP